MKIIYILTGVFLTTMAHSSSEWDESSEGRLKVEKNCSTLDIPQATTFTSTYTSTINSPPPSYVYNIHGAQTQINEYLFHIQYSINGKGEKKFIHTTFNKLTIYSIYSLSNAIDFKKIINNSVLKISPYLLDGTYPAGIIKYILLKTKEGITGNKPILDRSVPYAEFMKLTLSEDRRDLILTLNLAEELTV
ncbi:MAG: hypothetical protein V4544_03605 [Pseudomonadota bacterium]